MAVAFKDGARVAVPGVNAWAIKKTARKPLPSKTGGNGSGVAERFAVDLRVRGLAGARAEQHFGGEVECKAATCTCTHGSQSFGVQIGGWTAYWSGPHTGEQGGAGGRVSC